MRTLRGLRYYQRKRLTPINSAVGGHREQAMKPVVVTEQAIHPGPVPNERREPIRRPSASVPPGPNKLSGDDAASQTARRLPGCIGNVSRPAAT